MRASSSATERVFRSSPKVTPFFGFGARSSQSMAVSCPAANAGRAWHDLALVSTLCPRSGHMREGGLVGLAGCKVLFGCFSAKGSVGSVGVVAMLEGVDEWVEVLDAGWQVVDGVELVAPRAVASLHRA